MVLSSAALLSSSFPLEGPALMSRYEDVSGNLFQGQWRLKSSKLRAFPPAHAGAPRLWSRPRRQDFSLPTHLLHLLFSFFCPWRARENSRCARWHLERQTMRHSLRPCRLGCILHRFSVLRRTITACCVLAVGCSGYIGTSDALNKKTPYLESARVQQRRTSWQACRPLQPDDSDVNACTLRLRGGDDDEEEGADVASPSGRPRGVSRCLKRDRSLNV